jgi:hypothetical protein
MRPFSRVVVLLGISVCSLAGAANFDTPDAAVQSLEPGSGMGIEYIAGIP